MVEKKKEKKHNVRKAPFIIILIFLIIGTIGVATGEPAGSLSRPSRFA